MDKNVQVPSSVDSRQVYEPPTVTSLGTIEDMTEAVGNSGTDDGLIKTGEGG